MFDKGNVDIFRSDDKADWLRLWHGYIGSRHPERVEPHICEAIWQAVVSRDGRLHAHALRNREGWACGFMHSVRHFSTHMGAEEAYLMDLYVDPAFQGMGGGSVLIEHALSDCADTQCSRLTWITAPGVEKNEKFYSKYSIRKSWDRYVVTTFNACKENK